MNHGDNAHGRIDGADGATAMEVEVGDVDAGGVCLKEFLERPPFVFPFARWLHVEKIVRDAKIIQLRQGCTRDSGEEDFGIEFRAFHRADQVHRPGVHTGKIPSPIAVEDRGFHLSIIVTKFIEFNQLSKIFVILLSIINLLTDSALLSISMGNLSSCARRLPAIAISLHFV